MGLAIGGIADDPAELVARIAVARRERLLRIHRRRLRREDLEDCYSQATLELVARSRRSPFVSADHAQNALEQKFLSRIEDRRRAIGGRSGIETAIARSVPVDAENGSTDLEDRRAAVEQQVIARTELRRLREVIADLSRDQQLVLASQVLVDMGASEFCARHGWSVEKYRKVAQRARSKLRVLVEEYDSGERCRRLEADIVAMSAGVAEGQALLSARAHVANCPSCARVAAGLDSAARSIAAILPLPAAFGGGAAWLHLGGLLLTARRVAAIVRHPFSEAGYTTATAAGGSAAGIGALKVGVAVVCVAGAAGSYAVCAGLGVVPPLAPGTHHPLVMTASPAARGHHAHAGSRPATMSRGRATVVGPTSAAASHTPALAGSSSRPSRPRRLSAVQQTRREFGARRAAAASAVTASTDAAQSGPATSTAASPTAPAPPPAQSAAAVRQTRSEFGFER